MIPNAINKKSEKKSGRITRKIAKTARNKN